MDLEESYNMGVPGTENTKMWSLPTLRKIYLDPAHLKNYSKEQE